MYESNIIMESGDTSSKRRQLNDDKRLSKRITLIRNGNNDFKGTTVVVSEKRFPKFDLFMDEIGRMKVSRIPDINAISQLGTRYLYNEDGELITSIQQLQSGKKYICCAAPYLKLPLMSYQNSSLLTKMEASDLNSTSKTIFIILAGLRPRTIACLLLMKKLDITFEKLLKSIGEFLNVIPEKIQNIVTIEDVKITNVSQFFEEQNSVFVLFMSNKRYEDDLLLSVQEMDFINSTLLSQQKEKTGNSEDHDPLLNA